MASKKFQKKTQIEHVLHRPGMYMGSVQNTLESMWVYDEENNKIIKENINYTPGYLKCFDEIICNATDATFSDKTSTYIKIEYNKEEGFISVMNDGNTNYIPVEQNEEKIYIPEMIFGHMLTSSNYDDSITTENIGTNGIGAKLTNIFSKKFIVEVYDANKKLHYIQEWTNNMGVCMKPVITKLKEKKSYIKIKYYPDFEKFNILEDDHYALIYRRCIDICGINKNNINIYFNDEKIKINNFKEYINLYYPEDEVYMDETNEKFKIGIIYKPNEQSQIISFVNCAHTNQGGTHVNHVVDKIIKLLIDDYIKKKDLKISPQSLKDNLSFFINATIEKPTFNSQTKEYLTSKPNTFGSSYTPDVKFMKKLSKCGIIEQIIELTKFKENSTLKKTDGKKQIKISGIPKLEDANKAGSKESNKCSLILTEGDSAKTFAMSGLSIIGRDYFGIFPLKGKLLNTREATTSQLTNNEEINNLKQIIGLKHGENYTDESKFNTLRYGRIMVLTDADTDGSHIKGLIMNFIHSTWPSLIKKDNFLTSLTTPIVKAFKNNDTKIFYTLTDYNDWIEKNDTHLWKTKYYKGLGTSTSVEARESFVDVEQKLINYKWTNEKKNEEAILLAFEKSQADNRKEWLKQYDKNNILSYDNKYVEYHEFINSELIHFSNDDLSRSIPSLVDGLKPSQRKIIFGSFLRGLDKDEVKVSQLAGFVSDKAAYHHGEASLMGAIIGLAQDYVGSNNINLLKPIGQFGSRYGSINGQGKDSASPRYIWTKFEDLTTIIFNASDNAILNEQCEDNQIIEPEYYAPIIPMALINGIEGIGTGFSTKIAPYNPKEIINNIKLKIKGKEMNNLEPYWNGFKGRIVKVDDLNYEIYGKYEIKGNKLIITDLPIGEGTLNYKEFLDKMLNPEIVEKKTEKKIPEKKTKKIPEKKENPFIGFTDNNTDTKIYFELEFTPGYLETIKDIDKMFKLVKKYSITNMHLFDTKNVIKKFNTINEIIDDYYVIRLALYKKRKEHLLDILLFQLNMISYKVKFILLIVEKKLIVSNRKKTDIEEDLIKLKFPKLGTNKDDKNINYNYLLSLPIYNLTYEKIEELKKQNEDKQTEYDELFKLSEKDIWLSELNKLDEQYDKWLLSKNEVKENTKIMKNKKK
jgi:DNA topoisomerase-2